MSEHEKLSIVADKGLEWKEEYEAASETLRQFRYAMRQAIKNAGGISEVAVSDEFLLMAVPAEMGALKHAKDKLERENAALREFRDGIRELFPDELAKYPEFVGSALTEEEGK